MRCKRARRAPAVQIEKSLISEGFAGPLGNGLPCGFRKRITMGGMGMPAARTQGRAGQAMISADNGVGKSKRRALAAAGGSEGVGEHVRTRSHRPKSRRRNCGLQTVRTERRKSVFLLPDRLRSAQAPFQVRS